MENQNPCDAMIWIGQSYAHVLCDKEVPKSRNYCYQENGNPQRCYVHEAETRGCCRKIPRAVDWLVPGTSRIFLAHRDNRRDTAEGSIFGYFILRRFEHIISEKVGAALFEDDKLPWVEQVSQEILGKVLVELEHRDVKVILGESRNQLKEMIHKQFEKYWANGIKRQIERGFCVTPRLIPTKPREWPSDEARVLDLPRLLEDLVEDQIIEWMRSDPTLNRIRQRSDPNHAYIERSSSMLEQSRFCSKRLKVGATYLVDALTAEISDAFNRKLSQRDPVSIETGEEIFKETMNAVRKKYKAGLLSMVDFRLHNYANLRGELVLFNQPYPLYRHRPRADFRGLLRIDGDKQIDAIREYYETGKPKNVFYPYP